MITAVLCIRNEAAFLLDWLAHHYACGVDHVVVLSNDCQDGSDKMLDALSEIAPLTHIRNDGPYDMRGIQFTALKLAQKAEAVRDADWLLTLDIDEFVNIHVGQRRLPDLLATLPEASAITLTWRLFGNSGVAGYEDRPVPEQFLRAAPRVMLWPWRAAMFKTLFRNDGSFEKLGVHRPRKIDPKRLEQQRWFDGSGRALPTSAIKGGVFSDYRQDNHSLVQLNHYPLGAMESYLLKVDRGRAVHEADQLGMDYWVERNWCAEEDTSILELSGVTEARTRLKSHAEITDLHEAAVQWRRKRIGALLQQEVYRALLGRLLMTPPSRPLEARHSATLIAHALSARQAQRGNPTL